MHTHTRLQGFSDATMRAAAATALSAAAVKARVMADAEEREVQRLVVAAVEAQFRKVQAKIAYVDRMDALCTAERLRMEGAVGGFLQEHARKLAQIAGENLGNGGGAPEAEGREEGAGAAGGVGASL
jgi:SWI/SNF related-matrix-associated actin-dependent regulator of chromatin subfamily C